MDGPDNEPNLGQPSGLDFPRAPPASPYTRLYMQSADLYTVTAVAAAGSAAAVAAAETAVAAVTATAAAANVAAATVGPGTAVPSAAAAETAAVAADALACSSQTFPHPLVFPPCDRV